MLFTLKVNVSAHYTREAGNRKDFMIVAKYLKSDSSAFCRLSSDFHGLFTAWNLSFHKAADAVSVRFLNFFYCFPKPFWYIQQILKSFSLCSTLSFIGDAQMCCNSSTPEFAQGVMRRRADSHKEEKFWRVKMNCCTELNKEILHAGKSWCLCITRIS